MRGATPEEDGDCDGPLVLECTLHAGQAAPKSIAASAKPEARAWEATPIPTESMPSDNTPAGRGGSIIEPGGDPHAGVAMSPMGVTSTSPWWIQSHPKAKGGLEVL